MVSLALLAVVAAVDVCPKFWVIDASALPEAEGEYSIALKIESTNGKVSEVMTQVVPKGTDAGSVRNRFAVALGQQPLGLPDPCRELLKFNRRYLQFMRETVAWYERLIQDLPAGLAGEQSARLRQTLERSLKLHREELRKLEIWNAELGRYDERQQLGQGDDVEELKRLQALHHKLWPAVAPMPREVQPKP